MNHLHHTDEYQRLVDAAKARANVLRDEAMQEMWNGAGHALRSAVRAGNRLAHSLARHLRLRKHQGA